MAGGGGGKKSAVRVMYVHGLEGGGVHGRKVDYLRTRFEHVQAVDNGTRGVLGRLLVRLVALGCVAASGVAWLYVSGVVTNVYAVGALAAAVAGVFYAVYQWSVRRTIARMLVRAVRIQRAALREFKPDVLVGSSFGGATVYALMYNGDWQGPTVFLAPAMRRVGGYIGLTNAPDVGDATSFLDAAVAAKSDGGAAYHNKFDKYLLMSLADLSDEQKGAVWVIHGDRDTSVALQDSHDFLNGKLNKMNNFRMRTDLMMQIFVDATSISYTNKHAHQLKVVPGADHRLLGTLDNGYLVRCIEQAAAGEQLDDYPKA